MNAWLAAVLFLFCCLTCDGRSLKRSWNEDGNTRWSDGCEWRIGTYRTIKTSGEQCGPACRDDPKCTYFTYSYDSGECALQNADKFIQSSEQSKHLCGYINQRLYFKAIISDEQVALDTRCSGQEMMSWMSCGQDCDTYTSCHSKKLTLKAFAHTDEARLNAMYEAIKTAFKSSSEEKCSDEQCITPCAQCSASCNKDCYNYAPRRVTVSLYKVGQEEDARVGELGAEFDADGEGGFCGSDMASLAALATGAVLESSLGGVLWFVACM